LRQAPDVFTPAAEPHAAPSAVLPTSAAHGKEMGAVSSLFAHPLSNTLWSGHTEGYLQVGWMHEYRAWVCS